MKTREIKLIEKIHADFDSAQERLLLQAQEIIKKSEITATESAVEKIGDRLKAIGFVNVPVATQASEIKKVKNERQALVVKTKEEADLINYYKQSYPFLKFLTEDELNRLCEKYNLIHAPVANYIKDVPEKNLRDIENAQALKEMDLLQNKLFFRTTSERNQQNLDRTFLRLAGLTNGEITESDIHRIISNSQYHLSKNMVQFYCNECLTSNTWLFAIVDKDLSGMDYYWNFSSVERIDKSGLFIAAPSTHFNLDGLKKKSKHGFFSIFETEVKDPIVFRYVRGGVQVITKWGLEANDPALVVPILN